MLAILVLLVPAERISLRTAGGEVASAEGNQSHAVSVAGNQSALGTRSPSASLSERAELSTTEAIERRKKKANSTVPTQEEQYQSTGSDNEDYESHVVDQSSIKDDVDDFLDALVEDESTHKGAASDTASAMDTAMNPLRTYEADIETNVREIEVETEDLTKSLSIITERGEKALDGAKAVSNLQIAEEEEIKDLASSIQSKTDGGISNMKTYSSSTLKMMNSEMEKEYNDVILATDTMLQKTTDKLRKFEEADTILNAKSVEDQTVLGAELKAWQKDVSDRYKETTKENAVQTKNIVKAGVTMVRDMDKSRSLIAKAINVYPNAAKGLSKWMIKQNGIVSKFFESSISAFEKSKIGKKIKQMSEAMKKIQKNSQEATKFFLKKFADVIKLDDEKSESYDEKSNMIGAMMEDLIAKSEKGMVDADTIKRHIETAVQTKIVEMMAKVMELDQRANTQAAVRTSEGQQNIDKAIYTAQAKLDNGRNDLFLKISHWLAEIETESQEKMLLMANKAANIVQVANSAKVKAQNYNTNLKETFAESDAKKMEEARLVKSVHDQIASDANEMAIELSSAEGTAAVSKEDFNRRATRTVDNTADAIRYLVDQMPREPTHHLETVVREVERIFDESSVDQGKQLTGLEMMMDKITGYLKRNPGSNDVLLASTVPGLKKDTESWKMYALKSLASLIQHTEKAEKYYQHYATDKAKQMESRLNSENSKMLGTIRANLREKIRNSATELNKRRGRNQKLASRMGQLVSENTGIQAYVQKLNADTEDKYEAVLRMSQDDRIQAMAEISNIEGAQLSSMFQAGIREDEKAESGIKAGMDKGVEDDEKIIDKGADRLTEHQAKTTDAVLEVLNKVGAKLLSDYMVEAEHLEASKDATRHLIGEDEQSAINTEAKWNSIMDNIIRRAKAQITDAERVEARTNKNYVQTKAQVENMQAHFDASIESEVGFAVDREEKEMKKDQDALNDKFEVIDSGRLAGMKHKAEMAAKAQRDTVNFEQAAASEAGRVAKKSEENMEKDTREVEKTVNIGVRKVQSSLKYSDVDVEEEAEMDEEMLDGSKQTSNAVSDSLEQKAGEMMDENDVKMEKLTDTVESEAQTVLAKIKMKNAAATSAIENGETLLHDDDTKMTSEDMALFMLAHHLDDHRKEFEKTGSADVMGYLKLVSSMATDLMKDKTFLENYQAYSLSGELMLIQDIIEAVTVTRANADSMFDGLLDEEYEFMQHAMKLEGGGGFGVLKKLRDSDFAIQEGVLDDERLLRDLDAHEKMSMEKWPKILVAAESAFHDVRAKEAALGNKPFENKEEDKLGKFLGKFTGSKGNGTDEFSQFGQNAEEAAAFLLAEDSEGDVEFNKTLNRLQQKAAAQEAQQLQDVHDMYEKVNSQDANSNTGGNLTMEISKMVQALFDNNAAAAAQQKAETQQTLNDMANKAMGVSLLETKSSAFPVIVAQLTRRAQHSPRMMSLIQQNSRLRRLHAGLNKTHEELGSQVEKVASLAHAMRKVDADHDLNTTHGLNATSA
jgi:hypothetical protein